MSGKHVTDIFSMGNCRRSSGGNRSLQLWPRWFRLIPITPNYPDEALHINAITRIELGQLCFCLRYEIEKALIDPNMETRLVFVREPVSYALGEILGHLRFQKHMSGRTPEKGEVSH